ncbi:hypothetical protein L1887_06404 [Cichorium endivia]|nr:hypothetical protein L1887_06404 [Cichorium endivia]
MSDNIPLEIQVEIMKRLPVKSLLRFRSVSKPWNSLIHSHEFIAGYKVLQTEPQRLLVWHENPDTEEKHVSFVDDETFAQQEFNATVPVLAKLLNDSRVVGSSQGLLCLHGYYRVPGHSGYNSVREMIVLWNPSIRKSVGIAVPGVLRWGLETILGFGVCPITSDPTIVKISQVNLNWEMRSRGAVPWVVEVFTLSAGCWRIPTSNLPNKSIKITWSQVVLDRFIYWVAFDKMVAADGGLSTKSLIMSFDMTTQEFRVIDLPESLARQSYMNLSVCKVCESLAVLEYCTNMKKQVCNVWVMDSGVPNLFTKLLTIDTPYASMKTLGFTRSGEPIMQAKDYYKEAVALVVYNSSSGHLNDIRIDGNYGSFFVDSYMETLLLLDQSHCRVYSIIN